MDYNFDNLEIKCYRALFRKHGYNYCILYKDANIVQFVNIGPRKYFLETVIKDDWNNRYEKRLDGDFEYNDLHQDYRIYVFKAIFRWL